MSTDTYYDMHMEGEDEPERSKGAKVVIYFFKALFWIILTVIMAILIWRMIGMKEPGMANDFLANKTTLEAIEKHSTDSIASAYKSSSYVVSFRTFDSVTLDERDSNKEITLGISDYGYDGFQVFTQYLHAYYLYNEETDSYDTIERSEYFSEKGHADEGDLKISNAYFMPQANQLTVTFRYNSNAAENLYATYPEAEKLNEKFLFVISDNYGRNYTDYSFISAERQGYVYRRLLFDGIDFTGVTTLNLDIYYINSENFSSPYRTMIIYDSNLTLDTEDIELPMSVTSSLVTTANSKITNEED